MKFNPASVSDEDVQKLGIGKRLISSLYSFIFSFSISWKASKTYFMLRILLEVLTAIQPVLLAYIGREIINTLVSFAKSTDYSHNTILLLKLLSISLALQVLGTLIKKVNDFCTSIHQDLLNNFIEVQISRKTATLDISYFDSPKFHNELLNARRDSSAVPNLAWHVVSIIRSLVQLITTAALVVKLNPFLPVLIFILNVPTVLTERNFAIRIYRWTRKRAPEQRKMQYLLSIITGANYAKDIRMFDLNDELFSRYNKHWDAWFKEKQDLSLKRGIYTTITTLIPQLALIGITFYIGIEIVYGRLTLGDYTFYNSITQQLTGSITALISSIAMVYEYDLKISNYRNFLETSPAILDEGSLIPSELPSIEFKNVSFMYPGTDKYVLKNVSFKIESGEKVALVGLNGSGKSTITKLILRFYDVTDGQILIDGIDIKKYNLKELRKRFTAQFQDFANYAFTARESITISDLENMDDYGRIAYACEISGTDKLAEKWPYGLDTYLTRQFDEQGVQLSGGEWQKIALARSFFRDAGIIILDEPSSALDPEAEKRIFELISELCKGKGAIFISHRLSNVTMADKIIVIENGSIIECGSHNQLIEKNGRYAYLFNLQAEKYIQAHMDFLKRKRKNVPEKNVPDMSGVVPENGQSSDVDIKVDYTEDSKTEFAGV